MEQQNLKASREALTTIKGIVGDSLASPQCVRPTFPRTGRLTRTELAYGLKRLQHAELVHYLRFDASREVLLMIRESIEETMNLLDAGDEEVVDQLRVIEPYRHQLYARVVVIALLISEREAIQHEMKYWRQRNAMRIVQDHSEAVAL
ncbi:MAG TPA: hypothetical protein VF595_12610 [Tepidisphaeraceae bacterium]